MKLLMKKEALFAIIIGVTLGLGITYGIYQFRQSTAQSGSNEELIESTITTPTSTPSNETLLITSPKDGAVLEETRVRLSGTSQENNTIVIFVNDREYITQADNIGAFAQDIELDMGGNKIKISAVNESGDQETQEIDVVVSTASLEEKVEEASPEAKPTSSTTGTTIPSPTRRATATPNQESL